MTGPFAPPGSCLAHALDDDLTICTVSFNSATYLRQNRALTQHLNAMARVRWIVAENSPAMSPERLSASEPGFQVIQGAGPGHTPTFHHTLALRECVRRSTTRFVLVLDPDLFVLRPQWVDVVKAHMQERKLAIFATPWHPQSQGKYRYFPSVHFALFDTHLFDRDAIDFRPDFLDGVADPEWPQGWDADRQYFATSGVARALSKLPIPFLKKRRQYYTDTGSRLYKQHVCDPGLRFEVLDPVYDRHEALRHLSLPGRLLERALPDELCYVPKHYPRSSGPFLTEIGATDVARHWEQFTWKSEPFCFHVRRNAGAKNRKASYEAEMVGSLLTARFGQLPAAAVTASQAGR